MTDFREQVAIRYFDALEARDFGALNAVVINDVVFEMPYAPPGMPARHEGRAAVEAFYRAALGGMRFSRVRFDRVIGTQDPTLLVVEGHGDAETTDGRPYRNRYAWLFVFAPDGRIASLREYADPLIIIDAFGPPAGGAARPGAPS